MIKLKEKYQDQIHFFSVRLKSDILLLGHILLLTILGIRY